MRIVVWIPVPIYKSAVLTGIADVPGVELVVIDDPNELPTALGGAVGMISAGASKYTAEVAAVIRSKGTSLRWFQTVAAGNDGLMRHGMPAGITITGSGGHSAPVVAEHALALLLSISHAVHDFVAYKSKHTWGGDFRQRYRSLYRKTVTVVGFGNIGVEIARRLKAFDIHVLSVTRSGAPHEAAAEAYKVSDLRAAIAKSDAVILSLPLTAETRGIIGAAELAAFRPSGFLVNIARGGLVDQVALGSALREGRIAGAAIDVTDPEPPPADDPLWDAPNLIISPHFAGGGSTESPKRLAATIRDNLTNFIAGRPLSNIITLGA